MTIEEWQDDIKFIDDKISLRYLYQTDYLLSNKILLKIEISNSKEARIYDPYMFLDLLIFLEGEKAELIKNSTKKIIKFNGIKSSIIHQIQAIKQELENAPLNIKNYDFTGKIMQVDSLIDIIKSQKDTKDKKNRTISFAITSLIALAGIVSAFVLHYVDVKHENDRAIQIQVQIKELQEKIKMIK